jgi:transcriptional regulator with XRE-family HTH domain
MTALLGKYTGASPRLGKIIAEAREKKNLTQQDLAKLLGVQRGTILRFEKGLTGTHRGRLEQMCEILGIDLQAILEQWEQERAARNRTIHATRKPTPLPDVAMLLLEMAIEIRNLDEEEQELIGHFLESIKKQIDYFKRLKGPNGT